MPGTVPEVAGVDYVLARNLRAERARLGLRQSDVADRLGWSPSLVSLMETGQRRIAAAELPVLCRLFGVTLADLLRGADPEDLDALGL
jgi:transcriptional regulator with XRE-family HTH domain